MTQTEIYARHMYICTLPNPLPLKIDCEAWLAYPILALHEISRVHLGAAISITSHMLMVGYEVLETELERQDETLTHESGRKSRLWVHCSGDKGIG